MGSSGKTNTGDIQTECSTQPYFSLFHIIPWAVGKNLLIAYQEAKIRDASEHLVQELLDQKKKLIPSYIMYSWNWPKSVIAQSSSTTYTASRHRSMMQITSSVANVAQTLSFELWKRGTGFAMLLLDMMELLPSDMKEGSAIYDDMLLSCKTATEAVLGQTPSC